MKNLPLSLMNLLHGYRTSRILLTAIELDLFSALETTHDAANIARQCSATSRGMEILLHALCAMKLIQKRANRFYSTKVSKTFLSAGGKHDWRLAIKHHLGLWENWSHLTDVVRTGHPTERHQDQKTEKTHTDAFIGLMHQLGSLRSKEVLSQLTLRGVTKVLDVGGGSGVYSIAFAKKLPMAQITLLDRPCVIFLAKQYVSQENLRERIVFQEGDLRMDALGAGFDLVFISSICHMLSPAENQHLLSRAYDALLDKGQIVLQDFVLRNDRTGPTQAALFAVNMLVGTQEGNSYTAQEYCNWLAQAGFQKTRLKRLRSGADLMMAKK